MTSDVFAGLALFPVTQLMAAHLRVDLFFLLPITSCVYRHVGVALTSIALLIRLYENIPTQNLSTL